MTPERPKLQADVLPTGHESKHMVGLVNALPENKPEGGRIRLGISGLRRQVLVSREAIGGLCRLSMLPLFKVYIECIDASNSVLWRVRSAG